ncbi:MAG TPA: hypothetical protein VL131_03560 [Gammaproteobacteria bacterium]|nr:hypothetical protein [Gammaproteobacteria bacterium]
MSSDALYRPALAVLAAAAFSAVGTPLAAAPTLDTYVITIGGEAQLIPPFGCSTFGPPAAEGNFFSSGGVSPPTDGLATCHVAGGFNAKTSSIAPLGDTSLLSTTFVNGDHNNSFDGSSTALAQYGVVSAAAHASTTGATNNSTVYGSEGLGIATDTLTITSPSVANGAAGKIVYTFHVDGTIAAAGPGTSILDVNYQQGNSSSLTLMRSSVDPRFAPFITAVFGSTAGFALTNVPGTMESYVGSGDFQTFQLDFTYGTPFDFAFGLRALTFPAIGTNDVSASTSITGISVFASGSPVTSFLVSSASGTAYDAAGAHVVPLPPSALLLTMALLALVPILPNRARASPYGSTVRA